MNHEDFCTQEMCNKLVKIGFDWIEFSRPQGPIKNASPLNFEKEKLTRLRWNIPTWAAIKWLRENGISFVIDDTHFEIINNKKIYFFQVHSAMLHSYECAVERDLCLIELGINHLEKEKNNDTKRVL